MLVQRVRLPEAFLRLPIRRECLRDCAARVCVYSAGMDVR